MCTGRIDLAFVLHAFKKGADGVIIGGCWPGECHYVTEGNYDALGNMYLCRKLMKHVGVSPERLRLEWIAASEGNRFAEVMSSFVAKLRELGPLGEGEGIDGDGLKLRLEASSRIVPYLKLAFYESDEADRLFQDLVAEKLAVSQILMLLEEKPLSTREISERLDLNPSDVSRHMNDSSRQGLVTYDLDQKCYALP
jgi:coenzyme F420-reducing hydrogenase delta subunit